MTHPSPSRPQLRPAVWSVLASVLLIGAGPGCGARSATTETDVSADASGAEPPSPSDPAPSVEDPSGATTTPTADAPSAGPAPTASAPAPAPDVTVAPSLPSPTAEGCFDASTVPSCADTTYVPDPPERLLDAAELGEGFRFVTLGEGIALAQSPSALRLVLLRGELLVYDVQGWPSELKPTSVADAGKDIAIVGCDASGCSAWQALRDGDAPVATLEPLELPEQLVNLRGVAGGIAYLGDCLFGNGVWCRVESGAWVAPPGLPDEPIVQMRGSALLTETGRLLVHAIDQAAGDLLGSWSEPVPRTDYVRLSTSGWSSDGTVAYTSGGDVTYGNSGSVNAPASWASCTQSPAMLAGAGPGNRVGVDGAVYTEDYYRQPSRCRTELVLPDLLDERETGCGLSRNWILMTPDSLWSARGGLMCAVG